jgi:hypothetical protein
MTSKTISLDGKHKQIIDLNQDLVDFIVDFTITPLKDDLQKPYEIAITTQEKLDSGLNPKFTQYSGIFNKTIKNTSGNYQNYCLLIKSTTEFKDITIKINLTPLESASAPPTPVPTPLPPTPVAPLAPLPPVDQAQPKMVPTPTPQHIVQSNDSNKKMKIIVGFLIVVIGGCALYYFWNKSKTAKLVPVEMPSTSSAPEVVVQQPAAPLTIPSPAPAPAPVPSSGPAFSFY